MKVKLDLDAQLPTIMIDRIQIQQVLINLLRNSIEAMVSVEKRELTLETGRDETGFVQVTIRDTGPGLSPEVRSKLFQPFVTTKATGMGIGLTICQSIVEAHGGNICALQDEFSGAGFRIRLPLQH